MSAPGVAATMPPDRPPAFADVVRRRFMIRAYTSEPVPADKVRRILEYAARAPSAGNTQPWEFVVVRKPEVRDALAAAAQGQRSVATAPVVVVTCANLERAEAVGHGRAAFLGLVDTAFASLLILLGAVEQDLGACFVATFDAAQVAKILGLPEKVRTLALIPIGHPAEGPRKPPNPKIPLARLIHEDRW